MIYHSILFSLCLMGVASIDTTKCLIEEGKLQITCTSPESTEPLKCTITSGGKVVGSTNEAFKQDSNYKDKANIVTTKEGCKLTLTDFTAAKTPKTFNCTLETKTGPVSATVDTNKVEACSACSVLQYAGVTLLLALLAAPLLS